MLDCTNLSSCFSSGEREITFSLNEIRLWEKEKCCKMKSQIFPKLVAIFSDEHCLSKKIFILNTMTEKFLQCFSSEEEIINHYEPLLPEVFSAIEYSVQHLNMMIKFLANVRKSNSQCLEFYMNNLEENWKVILLLLKSVTKICSACGHSLLVLSWGLHCVGKFHELRQDARDTELLEKGNKAVELLEQTLAKFLRMDLLQFCAVTNPKQLFSFYLSIQYAYRTVNLQNAEYHALLWKLYANMVIQFDGLKQYFDSSKNSHLRYLCMYILPFLRGISHEVEKKGEKLSVDAIEHVIHMCCCYLRIITFLCRKFNGFDDECIEILYNLIYKFYYFLLHDALKYVPVINCQVRDNVTQNTVALMLCLLGERKFLSFLIQPVKKNLGPEAKITYWLLKLSSVQLLPFSKDAFYGSDNKCSCHIPFNIINGIMDDLYICDAELLFAYLNAIPHENRLWKITLYEYLYIVLCNSASKCCPNHFSDMEKLMLKILLRRTDIVSCLICDVWYFLCRCKSDELISKYCYLFEKLIPNIPCCTSMWIKFFVKRMTKLAPQLQFRDIWPSLAAEIVIEGQIDLKSFTGNLLYLVQHVTDIKPSSYLISFRRLKRTDQIICSLQNESTLTKDLHIETITCLLDLSTYIVTFCKPDPETLLQVLRFATIMWNSACDRIQICVLSLLQALGHIVYPLGSYKNKVLDCLGKLFNLALNHENYIMQHQALCTFYEYAHLAPHKEVVQKCITSPCNQPLIKNFFKKAKNKMMPRENCVIENVLCQGKWLRENKNIPPKNAESDILCIINSQETMDMEEMEELHINLKRMKEAAKKLASFKRLPPWALQSIKHTCQFIDKINNN